MTDWCTSFPETWGGVDIAPCCRAHDLAYETGAPKIAADIDLAACFAATTGDGAAALAVFAAVLVLGGPFYLRAWLRRRRR